ncbi:kinesin heavy chain, putative, partial [Ichthyophthirius multifiliis]
KRSQSFNIMNKKLFQKYQNQEQNQQLEKQFNQISYVQNNLNNLSLISNKFGILNLSMQDIFNQVEEQTNTHFMLKCSYIEIYNDQIYDLLTIQQHFQEQLFIGESQNKEFFVKGACEQIINSLQDIQEVLIKGEKNKHYAQTVMNHISSRSHAIFMLVKKNIYLKRNIKLLFKYSSERLETLQQNKSNFLEGNSLLNNIVRDKQNESKTINKSLFFLTQVINLKSQRKNDVHIPYRNSPLTKLLKSSLGGNSRTAIILCINPCLSQIDQSLSTLRFGLNAKKIQNLVQKNIAQELNNDYLRNIIKEYEKRIRELEEEKDQSKADSQKLLQTIQNLVNQKNNIQQRLKNEDGLNQVQIDEFSNKQDNISFKNQDYICIENVGLIKVFYKILIFSLYTKKIQIFNKQQQSKQNNNSLINLSQKLNENNQQNLSKKQLLQIQIILYQKYLQFSKIMKKKIILVQKFQINNNMQNFIIMKSNNNQYKQKIGPIKKQQLIKQLACQINKFILKYKRLRYHKFKSKRFRKIRGRYT